MPPSSCHDKAIETFDPVPAQSPEEVLDVQQSDLFTFILLALHLRFSTIIEKESQRRRHYNR